jgi:RNA polymerase sigma-70 factor (ECF subfamily)
MLISQEICNQYSDPDIVRKSLEDIDYFSCLYQRYEERLLRYIRSISKVTLEESEDILQDAFIKVWKNLHFFDSSLKLSSWLYRIVHNQVISTWRKDKWRQTNPFLELSESLMQTMAEDMEIPQFSEEDFARHLEALPEKYRQVLILRYFEEMSYEEISDILKIPEGTVTTRINRAKKAFASLGQLHSV